MALPRLSHNVRAVVWVLLGTATFSLVFASGKFAGDLASPLQVVWLRYVGGVLALACLVAVSRRGPSALASARPGSHLLRAITGCFGGAAIIYASAEMPIVDASAIGLLHVVFVIPLGMIFLAERVGRTRWLGILLSAVGAAAIMMSRGAFESFDLSYLWPASIALLGALLLAVEGILIRTLSQRDRALTVLLHVNLYGMLLLAIPAFATWRSDDLLSVLPFLLLGPIAISAQYCNIRGYRLADVSIVGPIDYTWLLFAALIGYAVFGEVPTKGVLLGAALVAAGGIVLASVKPGSDCRAGGSRAGELTAPAGKD